MQVVYTQADNDCEHEHDRWCNNIVDGVQAAGSAAQKSQVNLQTDLASR
jgi:hypothetical protein